MKSKSLFLSISAALTLLFCPDASFAGGGHGGGGGFHGGGFLGGGFRGAGFRGGGRFHGGLFYRYGWWPGFGWGWWGWGGYYPYWIWGDYYPYYSGDYYGYGGDDPSASGSGSGSGWQNENQALQARLAQLGFYRGRIDGVVGPETEAAIRAFQASRRLRVSGELDRETLDALGMG
jgi:hypothetical protein